MINFLYLAHSTERFRKQTVFSILSLLEYLNEGKIEYRIIVYTDEPAYFNCLEVETQLIDSAQIDEWKGPDKFVHRCKICMIIDAAEKFEGKLVYLDSDNCVFRSPVQMLKDWKEDLAIMQDLEYVLENPADLMGKKVQAVF